MIRHLKIIAIVLLTFSSVVGYSQIKGIGQAKKVDSDNLPIRVNQSEITFEDPSHDFGSVSRGDTLYHNFFFTNTGTENLLIKSVLTSCGCTATQFTNTPVKPGDRGVVIIEYRTKGKIGPDHNEITIKSNASNGTQTLKVSALIFKMEP